MKLLQKTCSFRFLHRAVCTAACAVAMFAFSSFAQDDEQEEKFTVSQERIDTINEIIAKYVKNKQNMGDATVQASILAEIGSKMELKPTAEIIEGDYKKLNAQAERLATKKFGRDLVALQKKYEAEALAKYPMKKLKDSVAFRYRRGNMSYTVSGTLFAVKKTNILVDSQTVSFIDMDDQTRSLFDAEMNATLRTKYVQDKLLNDRRDFDVLQQQIFDRLLNKQISQNEKNGYIYLVKQGQWRTPREIAVPIINQEAEKYRKKQEQLEKKRLAKLRKEAEARAQKEKEEKELAELEANAAKAAAEDKQRAEEGANALPTGTAADDPLNADRNAFAATIVDEPTDNIPKDILKGDEDNELQNNNSETFIAMSSKEISQAMNRIRVDQAAYDELMKKVDAQLNVINSTYFGIDADQGFKKALWGFSERDVYYVLSKEQEVAFRQKNVINRDDIIYPPGSRPSRIYLHYHLGALYKVDIYMGDLKPEEFRIYKNSLRMKYGDSDTQMKLNEGDMFQLIAEGKLSPDKLPVIINPDIDETGIMQTKRRRSSAADEKKDETKDEKKDGKKDAVPEAGEAPAPDAAAPAAPVADKKQEQQPVVNSNIPYVVVWEGSLSRGILSFYYDFEKKAYKKVLFEKIYLPVRLKNIEKAKADAAAKAAIEEAAAKAKAAETAPAPQEAAPAVPAKQ